MSAPTSPEDGQVGGGQDRAGPAPLGTATDTGRWIDLEMAAEYGFTPQEAAAMSMYL